MLLKLSINNYILIHNLEIDFREGFSAITGETGAGKSILLGALSLILGQRADSGILLDKSKKCVIEGLFMVSGYYLEGFFADNELDFEETVLIRREIGQNGKSRAFINDTPVNLALMKDLGDRLVNVHSQHSIITLNDSDFQLAVLDSYAGIQSDVAVYRDGFNTLVSRKKQLSEIEVQESRAAGEKDYYQFLLDELNSARIMPGELAEVNEQLGLLVHAEEIKTSLYKAGLLMAGDEESILSRLSDALHLISHVSKFKYELGTLAERIHSNYIDLKDIYGELNVIGEQVSVDPPRMETLLQRQDQLFRLMKKHQADTIEALLAIRQEIEQRVIDEAGLQEKGEEFRREITAMENKLSGQAETISRQRQKVASLFEKEVIAILVKLGIGMARFKIELLRSESLSKDGHDKVRFLFSANKGIELKELSVTASGGELSRLMLAVKSMISQKNLLPTIIFDEIDNGVSGEIAGKVGSILKRMGDQMQVIAITHLPQIAAKGDHHYWVYKSENKQVSATFIKQLTASERIREIAKMLSDEVVTDSAYNTANELLNN